MTSDLPGHQRFPGVIAPPDSDPVSTFSKQRGRPSRADRIGLTQMTGASATSSNRTLNWSIYTVAELVRFRDEIGRALPALELKHLNLEQEMLLQYHALRELQGDVLSDGEVPVNQRAQVANSVASTLKTLGDLQIGLYSSERFKDVENLLIRTLDKLPEEQAAVFIDDYEKLLRRYEKSDKTANKDPDVAI
jgi:hypothetical protein